MGISSKTSRFIELSPAINSTHDMINKEMHIDVKKFDVDFKKFYGIQPQYVDRKFAVTLSDLSYLPKVPAP